MGGSGSPWRQRPGPKGHSGGSSRSLGTLPDTGKAKTGIIPPLAIKEVLQKTSRPDPDYIMNIPGSTHRRSAPFWCENVLRYFIVSIGDTFHQDSMEFSGIQIWWVIEDPPLWRSGAAPCSFFIIALLLPSHWALPFYMTLLPTCRETTISRGKSGSVHIALAPARGLDSRCMISSKRQEPIRHQNFPVIGTASYSPSEKRDSPASEATAATSNQFLLAILSPPPSPPQPRRRQHSLPPPPPPLPLRPALAAAATALSPSPRPPLPARFAAPDVAPSPSSSPTT
ncbi:Protein of unknown function [Gryllus bimaculatus]|nr:Protein of unknown function [Gryllus bimaculatus]